MSRSISQSEFTHFVAHALSSVQDLEQTDLTHGDYQAILERVIANCRQRIATSKQIQADDAARKRKMHPSIHRLCMIIREVQSYLTDRENGVPMADCFCGENPISQNPQIEDRVLDFIEEAVESKYDSMRHM